jgi:hypothetical protein
VDVAEVDSRIEEPAPLHGAPGGSDGTEDPGPASVDPGPSFS